MLVSLISISHEGEASNLSIKVCTHHTEETPEMRPGTKGNDVIGRVGQKQDSDERF